MIQKNFNKEVQAKCVIITNLMVVKKPEIDIRDYFAAKAMQAIVSSQYLTRLNPQSWAADAYIIADAMLTARK